jgi:hypothetical protein
MEPYGNGKGKKFNKETDSLKAISDKNSQGVFNERGKRIFIKKTETKRQEIASHKRSQKKSERQETKRFLKEFFN